MPHAPPQIGSASFSQVYKCLFMGGSLDGQLGAAKVLTTGGRAEPLLKRLYDRETSALRAIQHPHIIQ